MPSEEDLAIFSKNNINTIVFPLFTFCLFYLPGFLFVNFFPTFYLDNFFLRQLSYLGFSVPIVSLGGLITNYWNKTSTKTKKMY